jgi:hypothetical protein
LQQQVPTARVGCWQAYQMMTRRTGKMYCETQGAQQCAL